MAILYNIAGLVMLVCLIMTIVQMFQKGGAAIGILGIIFCFIFPFIWGWINTAKTGQKNLMIIWSIAWAVALVAQSQLGWGSWGQMPGS